MVKPKNFNELVPYIISDDFLDDSSSEEDQGELGTSGKKQGILHMVRTTMRVAIYLHG